MQGRTTRKVSQISVCQHVSLGLGLHSPETENTQLTATDPIDSLEETETTAQQIFINGKLF